MNFEIYCDEALPDLFTSKKPRSKFLMIGALWLPASFRSEIKQKVHILREKHNTWGEIKWTKVSASKIDFYIELVDLFESYGCDLRFRCIAVEHKNVNWKLHNNDGELGFYRFYYYLLHSWISDFNNYSIFSDTKTNRDLKRLMFLKQRLQDSNLSSTIDTVQALPSKQVVLIQLADLLLGAASSRLNNTLKAGSAKEKLVLRLESHLGVEKLGPTWQTENKFNIFKIRLEGGW